jgi:V8-like Glu-specific endopeptidase
MRITQAQAAAMGSVGGPHIGAPFAVPPSGSASEPDDAAAPAVCCPGQAYAYPPPFTRFAVFPSWYQTYPFRTNGKVFFKQGGTAYVCSGTVVSSAGHWLVETAGHCVANPATRAYSTSVTFVPAYRSGAAPFGTWAASRLWAAADWVNDGNMRNDRGFIQLAPLNGRLIQDVVGSVGILFNQPYLQSVTAFGYPQGPPFTGATMQACLASTAETDPFISGTGSVPLGIGCDMTGGSSGGGWIVRFSSSGGYLNGHNDYQYTSPKRPKEMFSPYFDNDELSLYNCATDGTC